MSSCHQVQRILKVLGLSNALTLVPREMMSNMASFIQRSISCWPESGLLPLEQIGVNPNLLPTVFAHVIIHHQRNKTRR